MAYHKDWGIETRFEYNQAGWKMRQDLRCHMSKDVGTEFDATADECEEFGNDIRRSPLIIPLSVWDLIYKYPTSQQIRAYIKESETNGLKRTLSRSPGTQKIAIHEGKFIRWWESRIKNNENA